MNFCNVRLLFNACARRYGYHCNCGLSTALAGGLAWGRLAMTMTMTMTEYALLCGKAWAEDEYLLYII